MADERTVKDDVELAHFASELLDTEAQEAFKIIVSIQARYQHRANTPENLEMLRDEVLTKLAEVGILATVDPSPCFYGEPPVVELIGKIGGVQEFDHEQKGYEVNKANARNEEYLGQKERPNARRPKEK